MLLSRKTWNIVLAFVFALSATWSGAGMQGVQAAPQQAQLLSLTPPQSLPFSQNWTIGALLALPDNWSGVPGIVGYKGIDDTTATDGIDPQTVLTVSDTLPSVYVNQLSPSTNTAGGVAEFINTDHVVALQGSGEADAPQILISVATTGYTNIQISYNLRDIDDSVDNAAQPVALQYRVGNAGNFTNVASGFVPDATTGPSLATLVTPVSVLLPAAVENQPEVQFRILTWNAVGSDEWVGIDDISIRSLNGSPTVSATVPASGAPGILPATNIEVNFSEDVTLTDPWYKLTCAGSAVTAQVTGSGAAYTIDPDADLPFGAACTLTVLKDQVKNATNQPMAADYVTSFTITQCGQSWTPIATIQGATDTGSSLGVKTTQGFVTAVMNSPSGFFIQSAVQEADTNPLTSEGLYIFSPNSGLAVGNYVRLTGTVKEFTKLTEMDTVTSSEVCATGALTAPTYSNIDLTTDVTDGETLERYEGMLVNFTGELTVQQNFFQGRYGQITLASGGRIFGRTNGGSANDYLRMIVLDDRTSGQNPGPIPYYPADGALRAGDKATDVKGVLDHGPINSISSPTVFPYVYYRLQATTPPTFSSANPRPVTPPVVPGAIKVASFNVENYFTTLATAPYTYPYSLANTPRGANTALEFTRQKDKIIAGIKALNADVVGLMEIESLNSAGALNDLVTALNSSIGGAPTYAAIVDNVPDPDPAVNGYDFIQVALIYKPATVTPVGAAKIDLDPIFDRVPVAQTFQSVANGEKFSVVVNHFKSKGSCPASGENTDQGDGQGCWNARRVLQAGELLHFINTELKLLDPDVVVVGDLNAYSEEDPIDTLVAGGLINQAAALIPFAERYSYVFDGTAGYLDHVLTTASMWGQAAGASYWHINADEPSVIDYNTEFKTVDLYQPHVFRSSDHDPVVIGFDLGLNRLFMPVVSR